MGEKEKLEKWLDDMIEVHKELWNNSEFKKGLFLGCGEVKGVILIYGVVRIAEILGCCVEFAPSFGSIRACVQYKGCELVEYTYD
jgi:hypothetical protein